MARKLVTVRRISTIRPIKGADRIEVAVIDGWNCVVRKGQFAVGDLGVFLEIDSFLPSSDPRWAYLEKNFISWNGQTGFRIKSIKMKGQISQGLLDSLDKFPEISQVLKDLVAEHGEQTAYTIIRNMAFDDVLKVRKWEAEEKPRPPSQKTLSAPFPLFIKKTDQERCQNLPDVFQNWKDATFQETCKMDGSSMTVYFLRHDSTDFEQLPEWDTAQQKQLSVLPNGRFGVCSRNVDLAEHDINGRLFWNAAKKLELAGKLDKLNRNIAIQGELCGSSIQKNFEGFPRDSHDFFLFSVWDIDEQKHLRPKDAEAMAQSLGLKHVQVTGYYRLGDIANSVEELLARAEGTGLYGKKREGIVLKDVDGIFSFKAISNSYLLKHGE
ncbi:RNA ligase, DRB0094 family [Xylariales sp. PMI_506]|nr:RNA ligase, DRB0094 family [Xylariales sp. PMI_506]